MWLSMPHSTGEKGMNAAATRALSPQTLGSMTTLDFLAGRGSFDRLDRALELHVRFGGQKWLQSRITIPEMEMGKPRVARVGLGCRGLEQSGRPYLAQLRGCYWMGRVAHSLDAASAGRERWTLRPSRGRRAMRSLGSDGGRAAGLEDLLYPSFLQVSGVGAAAPGALGMCHFIKRG